MVTKEEVTRQAVLKLITDFKANYIEYKSYSEADIETKLVEELFVNILGWSKSDFKKQVKAGRGNNQGRADYAFKINDKIVFFLEVKKVGIPLEKEADKQVISYALSKRVPFAVSTNFEQMNVFCVEQENAIHNVFRAFKKPEDYAESIQDLLYLSKENVAKNLLLRKAENEGRLKRRASIDRVLLDDLMEIRRLIASDLEKRYDGKYEINEKDEIIQRILDRLIFIRRCEDVGINPDDSILKDIINSSADRAYGKLREFFQRYNEVYNSGLFAPGQDNDCDKIAIDGDIIKHLIALLYESKDKQYIYNFDWIDADVLGQVYEQYLGKILQQTKTGKTKLKEGQAHRKEQGIYYTPTYIVDYIVKNTVGELLKQKKVKVNEIKILDPACGSGSFLIKTFDYLDGHLSKDEDSKQHRLDSQGTYSIKTEILKKNIYGVDLDNKAVEITKLNLLLKAAEKNRKLPEEVDLHIRHGNSLIDDESVAGMDAFKWEGDFREGTFDVVIGNPPYISYYGSDAVELSDSERKYFKNRYTSVEKENDRLNAFCLFIEKGINLLKENGYLGLIINKTLLVLPSYKKLRKYLAENFNIVKIVPELDPFDVVVDATILILQKTRKFKKTKFVDYENLVVGSSEYNEVDQKQFLNNPNYEFLFKEKRDLSMNQKIETQSLPLKHFSSTSRGVNIGGRSEFFLKENKDNVKIHKYLLGSQNVSRYNLRWPSPNSKDKFNFIYFDLDLEKELKKKGATIVLGEENRFLQPKIIINEASKMLTATYDEEGYYCSYSFHVINSEKKEDLKYILGILNSNLMSYYAIKNEILRKGNKATPHLGTKGVDRLPIKMNDKIKQEIIMKVDKILYLNQSLNLHGNKKTSETAKLEVDIKKTNEEINYLVYKLYGITEEEKRIIEESLK